MISGVILTISYGFRREVNGVESEVLRKEVKPRRHKLTQSGTDLLCDTVDRMS